MDTRKKQQGALRQGSKDSIFLPPRLAARTRTHLHPSTGLLFSYTRESSPGAKDWRTILPPSREYGDIRRTKSLVVKRNNTKPDGELLSSANCCLCVGTASAQPAARALCQALHDPWLPHRQSTTHLLGNGPKICKLQRSRIQAPARPEAAAACPSPRGSAERVVVPSPATPSLSSET